jgi:hypothetical protein
MTCLFTHLLRCTNGHILNYVPVITTRENGQKGKQDA